MAAVLFQGALFASTGTGAVEIPLWSFLKLRMRIPHFCMGNGIPKASWHVKTSLLFKLKKGEKL